MIWSRTSPWSGQVGPWSRQALVYGLVRHYLMVWSGTSPWDKFPPVTQIRMNKMVVLYQQ